MRDLISLVVYVFMFAVCITLFINLLPLLIVLLIVFLVMRYFRKNNSNQNISEENQYQTNGSIKNDVIDVEYKETVEK